MNRGAWQATVHGVVKSQTRLSSKAHYLFGCFRDLCCIMRDLPLRFADSLVLARGLSSYGMWAYCSEAFEILVPNLGSNSCLLHCKAKF